MTHTSLWRTLSIPILSCAPATACLDVQPRPDFDRARALAEASTGRQGLFDPYAPALSDDELDARFADGLTLDEALGVALLENRDLQAAFQEIGIAHADWVQSRLLANPSLDVLLRFPSGGGRTLLEAAVGVELLELWRLPVRAGAARLDLDSTVFRIARRVGELLVDTRNAYYAAVAADELVQVAAENVALAERSFEAVRELHAAGAADAFDESLARGPWLAAELALRTARVEAANARRELAGRLSTDRPARTLVLRDPLPVDAPALVEPEALVDRALAARLDLRALASTVDALDTRVGLERRKAVGDAAAGPALERPAGSGSTTVGPSLGLTLPLFDQNQAQVARATFQLEQMLKLQEAARLAVAHDVRAGVERVNAAVRDLAFYDDEVLPQAARSLDLARASYAAGRTTLPAWIEVQRQWLEARRGRVALRLEAATSVSDLERTVGAPLR